jgi:hypothetical protein
MTKLLHIHDLVLVDLSSVSTRVNLGKMLSLVPHLNTTPSLLDYRDTTIKSLVRFPLCSQAPLSAREWLDSEEAVISCSFPS